MNISIFASIGAQNLGDELILKNEIELLKEEFSSKRPVLWDRSHREVYYKVASYDAHNPIFQIANTQYFEYFPLWIKQIKNIFRNFKNFFTFVSVIIWSDRVVIWWGGIIYDSEIQSVWNPLSQWLFRVRVARFFRKKIYFYWVWIDIKKTENTQRLQQIFKKAWKVTVRDEKSQKQLQQVWIHSTIIDDPVMNENLQLHLSSTEERIERGMILGTHNSQKLKLQDFESYDFKWKKIGLALRSGYISASKDSRVEKMLIEELCQYIEKKWGKITFLPHSFHKSDTSANDYEFMKQFLSRDRDICADILETYTIYNHTMLDIVVSMRLHSMILSHVYGIDQIALSYSQKTDEAIKKLVS